MVNERPTLKRRNLIDYNERVRENEEHRLKHMSERPKVTQRERLEKDVMIEKAAEFVANGIPFEMAPEELQKHHFFKVGYEIALRKQKIAQENAKGKNK